MGVLTYTLRGCHIGTPVALVIPLSVGHTSPPLAPRAVGSRPKPRALRGWSRRVTRHSPPYYVLQSAISSPLISSTSFSSTPQVPPAQAAATTQSQACLTLLARYPCRRQRIVVTATTTSTISKAGWGAGASRYSSKHQRFVTVPYPPRPYPRPDGGDARGGRLPPRERARLRVGPLFRVLPRVGWCAPQIGVLPVQ